MAVGDSAGEGREISGRRRTQLGLFPNGNVLIERKTDIVVGVFGRHLENAHNGVG